MKDSRRGVSRKTMDYFGKTFLSNSCGYYQIIMANSTDRMKAVFLQTNTEITVNANQVDCGSVVDPYYPTLCNVGFHGKAESVADDSGKQLKEYVYWYGMLARCYGKRELAAYKDCIVSEEFHDFSYFQTWFHEQIGRYEKDFQLDKDILSPDCKIYAEDTCVLVPSEINLFFVKTNNKKLHGNYPIGVTYDNVYKRFTAVYGGCGGESHVSYHNNEWSALLAYKRAKESRARELAEKWRGRIDDRVYDKLITYKVLLTD